MNLYGNAVGNLIDELSHLPGIGAKSAQRLAFHLVRQDMTKVERLSEAILEARRSVKWCQVCCTLTDTDLCPICSDTTRDKTQIMVVEDSRDMAAYEKTHQFHGLYHVLGGAISPLNGVEPADLHIKELLNRLRVGADEGGVAEIILATNPTVEGETTALYLARLIKPLGVKVTRIANGVPVGGELEYVDEVTLARAYQGRTEF